MGQVSALAKDALSWLLISAGRELRQEYSPRDLRYPNLSIGLRRPSTGCRLWKPAHSSLALSSGPQTAALYATGVRPNILLRSRISMSGTPMPNVRNLPSGSSSRTIEPLRTYSGSPAKVFEMVPKSSVPRG